MSSNLRRKMIQKDIKKYSELKINEWWNINIGSHIFKHYNSSKQRYSKEKMEASFENPSLKIVPYYIVNDGIYNMILCPSRTFTKEFDAPNDRNSIEEKKIEKSFLLGETEITQELYCAVMGVENPSAFQGATNPVENVSWYDAVLFCNKLSNIFGLERYYIISKNGQIIDTIKEWIHYKVETNENSKGFRLPTEWEWEYAAKAGTDFLYSGSNTAGEVGWYKDNSGGTTHRVKDRTPNAWGFYDMSGNVDEWCENKYDPKDENISANRVSRGGGWNYPASGLRSAARNSASPPIRIDFFGFRVARYI